MNAQAKAQARTQEIHKNIVRDLVDRRNAFNKTVIGCIVNYLNEIGQNEVLLYNPIYVDGFRCLKLRGKGRIIELIGELEGAEDDDGNPISKSFSLDRLNVDMLIEVYSSIV